MNDIPPEIRQALLQLLVAAIRELIELIAHVVSQVTGQPVIAPPIPPQP